MKNLFRPLAVVSALLALSPLARADGEALRVYFNSGESQMFILADSPVITFDGGNCVIKSVRVDISMPMETIDHAEFIPAGLTSVAPIEREDICFDMSSSTVIRVLGIQAGSTVALYNMAGVNMLMSRADSGGVAIIDVSSFSPGGYILVTNGKSFKFYRK
ncbi:MAG: T9SS type A sorting domain-containing protein [Clostridiales bacterium]|nr:T9SS type A sorting domain-containing protein [Clostridiales bacterium]